MERTRRVEEFGVIVGGRSGVGCVEMVEKMVVEVMGFLVEKEEEESGEVGVMVVIGMEEEMEESRIVEELVAMVA